MSVAMELKSWPETFTRILDGTKRYEVRKADRDFQVGQMVRLREWDPQTQLYTGREATIRITHLTPAGKFDLPSLLCVFGFDVLIRQEEGTLGPT